MRGKRAVIVGAGLGGLAAALRLSALGYRVVVCEAGERAGGKMNLWAGDGFRFDTGPSLITLPWVFRELFAAAGEVLDDHLELMRVHPHARYSFVDGTRLTVSTSMPEWIEEIRRLSPRDVDGFFRFMALGARLYELSSATFLRRPLLAPPDTAVWRALRRAPLAAGWGNYHATVARCFESPPLVQLYDRYPTYVGSSPYQAPATLALIPYLEMAFGAWHVRGGLYRIVESLVALLERRGVELRLGAAVAGIERRDGRAVGVRLANGEPLPAEVVVHNGDASNAARLLGEPSAGLPPEQRSLSGFVLLLALRRTLVGLPHHSVAFSADYRREFDQLFLERRFPDDPTVYLSAPSRGDRSLVPEGGGETLFVMANAAADGEAVAGGWTGARLAEARGRVLERLAKSGVLTLSAGDIVAESVWTPDRFAAEYRMPGGAIYGRVSHGWRGAFLRPPNRSRRCPNLYFVGGSTHPGGGTPTVLLSAKIVAELVARHEG